MFCKRLIGTGTRGIAMIAALLLAGCATPNGIVMVDPGGENHPITPEELDAMTPREAPYLLQVGDEIAAQFAIDSYRKGEVAWDYRLETGDSMEVRLMTDPRPGDTYRIDVGDLVAMSLLDNWQFNSTRSVRPDGMVSFPEISDIQAAGKTVAELRQDLIAAYERTGLITDEPRISVNVEYSNPDRLENMSRDVVVRPDGRIRIPGIKEDVLVAGLTLGEASAALQAEASKYLANPPLVSLVLFPYINTTLRDMNGVFAVRPDGRISVPRIGEIEAAGYSIDETAKRIAEQSEGLVQNPLTVSLNLVKITGSRIYVGGEVAVPGVYPLDATPTAFQSVIMARGARATGRMNSVLVIRRNPLGKPFVFKTNLAAVMKGETQNDVTLEPFDIVYVPKKPIAKANLFVDQYIDSIVPFDNQLGVTGAYYMNEQDVNTKSTSRNLSIGTTTIPGITTP